MNTSNRVQIVVNSAVLLGVIAVFFSFLSPQLSYGQVQATEQLRDLRKQLNQIQQQIISQNSQDQDNNTLSQPVASNGLGLSNQPLQRGDSGTAVKNLQVALNAIPGIAVSDSGPGSAGLETMYFGVKTERAVNMFQSRYRSSILEPIGLSSSTGIAGSRTKEKLASIIKNTKQPNDVRNSNQNTITQEQNDTSNTEIISESKSFNSQEQDSLSKLRSQFTLNKTSFTQEEKRQIYNMMPPAVQEKHLSNFLDNNGNSTGSYDSSQTDNPLQDRYRELQNGSDTSLRKNIEGFLALQELKDPLALLQKNLSKVFSSQKAHAQGVFIFGGRIASVEPCTTPPNALQVTVAGLRPGRFAFIPGVSQIRPAYNVAPRPAMNTLGNYAPVPGCYGPPPVVAPLTQGTIIVMGVSQI